MDVRPSTIAPDHIGQGGLMGTAWVDRGRGMQRVEEGSVCARQVCGKERGKLQGRKGVMLTVGLG